MTGEKDSGLCARMIAVAKEAAEAAGVLLREGFGTAQTVDARFSHDVKLSLDRACEEKILGVLRGSFLST